ncbi:unnamed protein product [Closterium sp. NIES-64]|nr:unnamed protein product [Closterium sp. NIES-64]
MGVVASAKSDVATANGDVVAGVREAGEGAAADEGVFSGFGGDARYFKRLGGWQQRVIMQQCRQRGGAFHGSPYRALWEAAHPPCKYRRQLVFAAGMLVPPSASFIHLEWRGSLQFSLPNCRESCGFSLLKVFGRHGREAITTELGLNLLKVMVFGQHGREAITTELGFNLLRALVGCFGQHGREAITTELGLTFSGFSWGRERWWKKGGPGRNDDSGGGEEVTEGEEKEGKGEGEEEKSEEVEEEKGEGGREGGGKEGSEGGIRWEQLALIWPTPGYHGELTCGVDDD